MNKVLITFNLYLKYKIEIEILNVVLRWRGII